MIDTIQPPVFLEGVWPFVDKTRQLLKETYGIVITDIQAFDAVTSEETYEINFISTIAGIVNTNMIFSFERRLARHVLTHLPFLTYPPEEEEEMLFETVSELLNIAIGNAMADFEGEGRLHFSPPIELLGSNRYINNKKYTTRKIAVTTQDGAMLILFSTEKQEG